MAQRDQRTKVFRSNLAALLGPRYSPRSRCALAKHTGIPLYTVSRILSGKSPVPSEHLCQKCAAFLGVTLEDLFDPALPDRLEKNTGASLREEVISVLSAMSNRQAKRTLPQVLDLVRSVSPRSRGTHGDLRSLTAKRLDVLQTPHRKDLVARM